MLKETNNWFTIYVSVLLIACFSRSIWLHPGCEASQSGQKRRALYKPQLVEYDFVGGFVEHAHLHGQRIGLEAVGGKG